jgi:hypothetical protein
MRTLKYYGLKNPIPKTARAGLGAGKGKGYTNILPMDSHIHYLSAKGISVSQPVFRSTKMIHNPLELTLYVPGTQGESELVPKPERLRRIKEAEKKMSNLFGGYTEVDATGGWVNDDKKLIQEPQGKVTAYTTPEKLAKGRKGFENYVKQIKKDYGQSAISIEYEGDLFFYEPKEKK